MKRSEIVVDASALVAATVDDGPLGSEARQCLRSHSCVAPHLIDAETGKALRRYVLSGELDPATANTARREAEGRIDRRYPHHGPLAERAWEMRDRLTLYDGLYLALAESLDCSLVTADQRLGRAFPGHELIRTIPTN